MKVLADSLISQDDVPVELYKEFMTDIGEEIDRENKIINDLLSLVKLDKKAADLHIEDKNINELLDQIDDVKEELNPDLENVRCFVTKYQKFNQAHLQGAEIIEEQYPIMRTKIRFSGVVARSTFVRMPVALHSPRSAAAEDYETLVNEYLDMIGDEDDGEI